MNWFLGENHCFFALEMTSKLSTNKSSYATIMWINKNFDFETLSILSNGNNNRICLLIQMARDFYTTLMVLRTVFRKVYEDLLQKLSHKREFTNTYIDSCWINHCEMLEFLLSEIHVTFDKAQITMAYETTALFCVPTKYMLIFISLFVSCKFNCRNS